MTKEEEAQAKAEAEAKAKAEQAEKDKTSQQQQSTPDPSKSEKSDDQSIFDEMIATLRADLPDAPELKFLKKADQIKTLMELKKASKKNEESRGGDKEEEEEAEEPKKKASNPAQSSAEPDKVYTTIMERNQLGGKWWKENIEARSGIRDYRGKK